MVILIKVLVSQNKDLVLASINKYKTSALFCITMTIKAVNKIKICKDLGNIHRFQHCLRSVSKNFTVNKMKDISLWGNAYEFSIDFGLISIANILNFHDSLM